MPPNILLEINVINRERERESLGASGWKDKSSLITN